MTKIILFILMFNSLWCKEQYLWPTNASTTVTALFGEERPHRYHAGLDIRTWGKSGYKLYATSDGHIQRIRTGSKGYGKALYIKLNDGNTAVYAHLDKFTPSLDATARSLQQHYGSYTIDHSFSENEFPVRRGDLIGYTGDTGGISGPHLHFEIRDRFERPLNPLQFYKIKDNLPPIPRQIAVVPLADSTTVNLSPFPQVYGIKAVNPFEYEVEDTITVHGKFGFALDVVDRIDDQPFKFGIHSIILKLNGNLQYKVQYDTYKFEHAKYIYTERDYLLKREFNTRFYRLFNNVDYEGFYFTHDENKNGYDLEQHKFHNFEIIVNDYYDNKISLKGVVSTFPIHPLKVNTNDIDGSLTISPDTMIQSISFIKTGPHVEDLRKSINLNEIGENTFELPQWEKPFTTVEIKPNYKISNKMPSQYLSLTAPTKISGSTHIVHYENGISFQFEEDYFSGKNAILQFVKGGKNRQSPMKRKSKNILATVPIPLSQLGNMNAIEIKFEDPHPYVFKREIVSKIIHPHQSFSLSFNAGEFHINGDADTFHDSTFVWIESAIFESNQDVELVAGPFRLGPSFQPMKKKVEIHFDLFNPDKLDNVGIFYFDSHEKEWIYVETDIDKKNVRLSSKILSGEIFAVLRETEKPKITSLTPNINATYRQKDISSIQFNVEDLISGIDGEKNVSIQIDDGKPLIHAYNSYRKLVHFDFENNLSKGEHSLYIVCTDNVGNSHQIRGIFYIK